ncbi:MAG: hypothetical protein ACD_67C00173G0002 [uncultured bacterium]|nr:MAG: hypothetical protein ACD_67C00173G0002 [uncultured bacterium]
MIDECAYSNIVTDMHMGSNRMDGNAVALEVSKRQPSAKVFLVFAPHEKDPIKELFTDVFHKPLSSEKFGQLMRALQ